MTKFFKDFNRVSSQYNHVVSQIRGSELKNHWRREFLRICSICSGFAMLEALEYALAQVSEELIAERKSLAAVMAVCGV
jgi:recombinational DNA repair ATPase RecF